MPSDVAPAPGEVFTDVREYMAALVLLNDQGHAPNVTVGDDEDSQQFVTEVRRLNRDWQPGGIPRVRNPQRSSQPRLLQPIVSERREPMARPRERRATTRRSASSRGDPDPEPPPPLRVIPPAAFRRELRRALGDAA
jgi:hypothetical protein